jgi:hypothetical protein
VCELPVYLGNGVSGEGSFCLELGIEPLWPQCLHAAGGEGAADQWPVCFGKTEHTVDRDIVVPCVEQAAHDVDLLEHSVDEFGAVVRTDEQSFNARPEEATFDLEVRTPPVLLGIDDIDAAGGHGQVVDVRLASRDPPVMQQPERF